MATSLICILFLSFFNLCFVSTITYTCDPTLPCGCTKTSTVVSSRIVGGEIAPNKAWGWIVSLEVDGSHMCGASLLSLKYAITAAHCIHEYVNNPSRVSILVGTNYLTNTTDNTIQRRTITKVIVHSNFHEDYLINDIAIIEFSPLTMLANSSLAFICLPIANEDPFQINSSLVAIGWGYTYQSSYKPSNSLRQVTLQVYSWTSKNCLKAVEADSNVQFCAGNSAGGKDTCNGDSGGPLLAFVNNRWILAGITSYGTGCAQPGIVGIYTRVSAYIPFIHFNTGVINSSTTTIRSNTTRINSQQNQSNTIERSMFNWIFSFFIILFLSFSYKE